ncbi:hypothetical protein [Cupriavidus necator]|uniref:hypothetical protein n=1 Tax=Cupriavidus necator TaxID=106590 RepID=UPI000F4FC7FC|nr:hypothetical protein [Cupriavidus necator]
MAEALKKALLRQFGFFPINPLPTPPRSHIIRPLATQRSAAKQTGRGLRGQPEGWRSEVSAPAAAKKDC